MATLKPVAWGALAAVLLTACALRRPPEPQAPSSPPAAVSQPPGEPVAPQTAPQGAGILLACDGGLQLRLRIRGDEVHVEGLPGGPEVVLRDAGGLTPQHTVFSNPRLRLELGVGRDASEAVLHLLQPQPRDLGCRAG